MNSSKLLNQAGELYDQASTKAEEFSGLLGNLKGFILEHFGTNGLYASYLVLFVLVVVIISRLAKITISTLKYLVVPALALAFLGSFFLPYSFLAILPATATFCSLFLLFKG